MNQKVTVVTILPLLDIKLELPPPDRKLVNGYHLVNRNSVSLFDRLDNEYFKKDISQNDWFKASNADFYLRDTGEPGLTGNVDELQSKAIQDAGERIDRFLRALDINEKLWSFRPHIRFSWFENDTPKSWTSVTIRHYWPVTTFNDPVTLVDFEAAAVLTCKIDEVYSETGQQREIYPAVRTAFDALRLEAYAFNVSMRFLQEAIAIETLCSSETTEVTHRIASTCAILLGSALEERRTIYKEARDLYGIRSRLIHGSGKRVKIEELKRIERLSRKLLRRILQDDIFAKYKSRSSQKEFLLELTLGQKF